MRAAPLARRGFFLPGVGGLAKSKVRGGVDVLKVIFLSADFLAAQREMWEIFHVYRSGFVRLFDTLTEPPAVLQDCTSLLNNTTPFKKSTSRR